MYLTYEVGICLKRVDLKIILVCNSVLKIMFPLLEYHSI